MPHTYYIDGSNVTRTGSCNNQPDFRRLVSMVGALRESGNEVRCFLDSTERHHLPARQKVLLARCLSDLPSIFVESRETVELILSCASEDSTAQVVTNDRYRVYEEESEWLRRTDIAPNEQTPGKPRLVRFACVGEDLVLLGIGEDGAHLLIPLLSEEAATCQIDRWVDEQSESAE